MFGLWVIQGAIGMTTRICWLFRRPPLISSREVCDGAPVLLAYSDGNPSWWFIATIGR